MFFNIQVPALAVSLALEKKVSNSVYDNQMWNKDLHAHKYNYSGTTNYSKTYSNLDTLSEDLDAYVEFRCF